MSELLTPDHQMPVTPAAPKKSFAEKMAEAKKKKAQQKITPIESGFDAYKSASIPSESPYVNQPPTPPPGAIKPPPVKARQKRIADRILFRLLGTLHPVLQNDNVEHGRRPHHYAANYGTILWPYKDDEPLKLDVNVDNLTLTDEWGRVYDNPEYTWLPRNVRYIFNARSPFQDEQEDQWGAALRRDNGQNPILDNPQNRDALAFNNRELYADSVNSVLTNFLWLSPQCENLHPKARRMTGRPIYKLIDFGQIDKEKVALGKLKEQCYELAKNARLDEMIPHARYLNIPFIESSTQEAREWDAIREDYKEKALEDPKEFQRTYADPKIKIIYAINRLVEVRELSINAITPGQAHWMKTRKYICMLPPDQDPVEFLTDFSLTEAGQEFANQIQAYKVNALI